MTKNTHTWIKFDPAAWMSDAGLALCTAAAQGVWIRMIAWMHMEGDPYGTLCAKGEPLALDEWARIAAMDSATVISAVDELIKRRVTSRNDAGAIFSKRLITDNNRLLSDRENGLKGGNPKLKQSRKPNSVGGLSPPLRLEAEEEEDKILVLSEIAHSPKIFVVDTPPKPVANGVHDPNLVDSLDPKPRQRAPKAKGSPQFEAMWRDLPSVVAKRSSKPNALRLFNAAASEHGPEKIVRAIKDYIQAGDPQYIQAIDRWLRDQRYLGYLESDAPKLASPDMRAKMLESWRDGESGQEDLERWINKGLIDASDPDFAGGGNENHD